MGSSLKETSHGRTLLGGSSRAAKPPAGFWQPTYKGADKGKGKGTGKTKGKATTGKRGGKTKSELTHYLRSWNRDSYPNKNLGFLNARRARCPSTPTSDDLSDGDDLALDEDAEEVCPDFDSFAPSDEPSDDPEPSGGAALALAA